MRENLKKVKFNSKQKVMRKYNNPLSNDGGVVGLKGNLAPEGAIVKVAGLKKLQFTGRARCFDTEESAYKAVLKRKYKDGDIIIIRYEGPKGGPGMPEMLTPTSANIGAGLGNDVAMITDGRFSGGSHGFIIGHVVPEAQEGGPIALIENGHIVTIDAKANKIEFELSDKELTDRKAQWKMPPYKASRGTLYKYIKNVKTASEGCVTDE